MQVTKVLAAKKNLLLCLDAFGTLFTPSVPIPLAYARAAARHGIDCSDKDVPVVSARFKQAFKDESKRNPNYGKSTSLGAEKWWGNIIRNTFTSFLKPGQEVPPALVTDLLQRYSTDKGYNLYLDVVEFFWRLQKQRTLGEASAIAWPFDRIVVGIITNSDDRVPGILESFGLNVSNKRFRRSSQRGTQFSPKADIDFVVLSYDVGHEKPDRRIFDAATSLLADILNGNEEGLTTDNFEKLYVGDDFEKDYDGARAAGWHAVLLDRNGVMDRAELWQLGRLGLEDKAENERKVMMARSLLELDRWEPKPFLETRPGNPEKRGHSQ